jgi:hypothetical protein
VALTAQIANDLTNWRGDLARFLDADLFGISQLILIFQRQRNVLNLTYRSFVLHSGDVSTAGRTVDETADGILQKCKSADMNIANTIREIVESWQLTSTF